MTLYAEKRKGRPTGYFIVEVERDGRRMKARASTVTAGEQIERDMREGRWQPETPPTGLPAPAIDTRLTLGQLYRIAYFDSWKVGQATRERAAKEVEWCVDLLGPNTPVDTLTVAHFRRIKQAKKETGVSLQTCDRLMAAFQSLITWARENVDKEGQPYTTVDPAVPYSNVVRERTKWFTADAQERIVKRMVDAGHTVEAVCCLAFGQSGLRANELLSLKAEQIGPDSILLTHQKNGVSGEGVPIQSEIAATLRQIIVRGLMPSYRVMLDRLKKAAKAEGFEVNERMPQVKGGGTNRARRSTLNTVSLHTLRHSTATRLILDGENPAVVQAYMRHASFATTQKYLKLTGEPKRNASRRVALGEGTVDMVLAANPLKKQGASAGDLRGILRGNLPQNRETVSSAENKTEVNQALGAQGRNRTTDTAIFSQLTYSVSYTQKT